MNRCQMKRILANDERLITIYLLKLTNLFWKKIKLCLICIDVYKYLIISWDISF